MKIIDLCNVKNECLFLYLLTMKRNLNEHAFNLIVNYFNKIPIKNRNPLHEKIHFNFSKLYH